MPGLQPKGYRETVGGDVVIAVAVTAVAVGAAGMARDRSLPSIMAVIAAIVAWGRVGQLVLFPKHLDEREVVVHSRTILFARSLVPVAALLALLGVQVVREPLYMFRVFLGCLLGAAVLATPGTLILSASSRAFRRGMRVLLWLSTGLLFCAGVGIVSIYLHRFWVVVIGMASAGVALHHARKLLDASAGVPGNPTGA